MKNERQSFTELERIAQLWHAGKISDLEFGRRTAGLMSEINDTKQLRQKLREIDSRYGKKAGPVVQGGLPSLGKH